MPPRDSLGRGSPGLGRVDDHHALVHPRIERRDGVSPRRPGHSRPGGRRPSRVREAEEAVHPPAAVLLPDQEGSVPAELRHAHAAGVAPGLLEGAKLRRVIRRDPSRRDGQTEVHVAQGRPVAPRHRRQRGGAPNRVERRPLEHRRVGIQRGIRLGVVSPVRVDETRVQRVDASTRLAGGRPRRRRTGEAYAAERKDGYPDGWAHGSMIGLTPTFICERRVTIAASPPPSIACLLQRYVRRPVRTPGAATPAGVHPALGRAMASAGPDLQELHRPAPRGREGGRRGGQVPLADFFVVMTMTPLAPRRP